MRAVENKCYRTLLAIVDDEFVYLEALSNQNGREIRKDAVNRVRTHVLIIHYHVSKRRKLRRIYGRNTRRRGSLNHELASPFIPLKKKSLPNATEHPIFNNCNRDPLCQMQLRVQ